MARCPVRRIFRTDCWSVHEGWRIPLLVHQQFTIVNLCIMVSSWIKVLQGSILFLSIGPKAYLTQPFCIWHYGRTHFAICAFCKANDKAINLENLFGILIGKHLYHEQHRGQAQLA